MRQVIDMGGFKNETIEVTFGDDTYEVKLDPPIEAYRQVLEMQGKKLQTEEDWDKYKGIVATIISVSVYPDSESKEYKEFKEKFFDSLTRTAAISFMNPYVDMLFSKRGGSKNLRKPPNKNRGKKK